MSANFESGKKVTYVCWNDKKHLGGTCEWLSFQLKPDTVACPYCGEMVKITQKL
jgi:DNA-directed RNA polymerase subunit RPC12/RpoP